MKTYLVIDQNCFLWSNTSKGIIYNSVNCKLFMFCCNKLIVNACEHFKNPSNLYSLEIKSNNLKNLIYKRWINNIIKLGMGQYLECCENELKPISLPPFLNNLKDVNKLRISSDRSVGENLLIYLHEIYLHVGGSYTNVDFFKMVDVPSNFIEKLTTDDIIKIINKVQNPYLNKINIIGNSILERHDLDFLLVILSKTATIVTFIVEGNAILSCRSELKKLTNSKIMIEVVCYPSDDLLKIENVIIESKMNYSLCIIVSSEEDINAVGEKISALTSEDYEIKPIYNGNNLTFIENYVYVNQKDLINSVLSKREIFAHQVVNTNFFGRLTIMPDCKVYASVNKPPLGTIDDSIYQILFKEMNEGTSWRMIRDMEPCVGCLYQYLCQSPSNYELVIGRPNLCSIKQ